MHCCTGNGTRALYYAWESILTYGGGTLRVNLLLNRASAWADVDSHLPYAGRVDVRAKQDLDLEIRLPEGVAADQVRLQVDATCRAFSCAGRYARVGRVRAGQVATLRFPVSESTTTAIVEKHPFAVTRRGSEVVHIDPPGRNRPLYQRGHLRTGQTLWRRTTRFVPAAEIPWS
jgi:DUF1680 family protein